MAANTYTYENLRDREKALCLAAMADHRRTRCGKRAVIRFPMPFGIIVHDSGASMIVNGICNKCRDYVTRSEDL